MNIINNLNIKLFVSYYITQSLDRWDDSDTDFIFSIYNNFSELEGKDIFEKWQFIVKIEEILLKKLLKISDEEFLNFIKQSLEYIYKREYWKDNLYESFDKEPEDNYYWILWNYFTRPSPRERKYHQELYDFYKEKSKETLNYLWRKNKQSLKNEPEDNIWCIENIERVEKYRERLLSGEFNKEGVNL